jgi:cobalt-zinc-cadmium efflux system membrane fusion protein
MKAKWKAEWGKPVLIAVVCLLLVLGGFLYFMFVHKRQAPEDAKPTAELRPGWILQLTEEQTRRVRVGEVVEREFTQDSRAIGIIDFNQHTTVPVFTPYEGRVGRVLVVAGDDVRAGQVLYTVNVPELAEAAANLVSTAGVLKMSDEALNRAHILYETKSISRRELEEAISEQQTADAEYRAALKTIGLFGLNNRQIREVLEGRKINTEMPVLSPVAGRVIHRAAAPGLLIQPGEEPAPITVSDTTALWMVANIPQSDISLFQVGQAINAAVAAHPGKVFSGTISYVGNSVDPETLRVTVRAEIADKERNLLPRMLAEFRVVHGEPVKSVAVPERAISRDKDGSFIVWVALPQTASQFSRRVVRTGMRRYGYVEILDGLQTGERIAQSEALFLNNLFIDLQ